MKQLMSYQGLDNLGHWDDCGAAQGGGTYAAISSTAVDENFAQIELENLVYDVGEGFSMNFRRERVDFDARIHDNDSSEQEVSESSLGPAISRQLLSYMADVAPIFYQLKTSFGSTVSNIYLILCNFLKK